MTAYSLRAAVLQAIILVVIWATGCYDSEETTPVELDSSPEAARVGSSLSSPAWVASVVDDACVARAGAAALDPAIADREEQYLQVSHLPPAQFFDVVFVIPGYTYASGSSVYVELSNGETFQLKTDGYKAYADTATSRLLVAKLVDSESISVTGRSEGGIKATDTYSLSSFPAAYAEIGKACGKPDLQDTDRVGHEGATDRRFAAAVATITAWVTLYEETLNTCKPLVDAQVRSMVDGAWEQWRTNNEAELNALDRGRSKLIADAKAAGGVTELAVRMGASIREAKQEAREAIESLPPERQSAKCYGILVELNEGRLDLAEVVSADLRVLTR